MYLEAQEEQRQPRTAFFAQHINFSILGEETKHISNLSRSRSVPQLLHRSIGKQTGPMRETTQVGRRYSFARCQDSLGRKWYSFLQLQHRRCPCWRIFTCLMKFEGHISSSCKSLTPMTRFNAQIIGNLLFRSEPRFIETL